MARQRRRRSALLGFYRRYGRDLRTMSEHAVLNANYLRHAIHREAKDAGVDHLFVDGARTDVAKHEFTLSMQPAKEALGVTAMDIAKGLLDMGYMAPTVYFPLVVPECLMIEPTEEAKDTLDRFAKDFVAVVGTDPPRSTRRRSPRRSGAWTKSTPRATSACAFQKTISEPHHVEVQAPSKGNRWSLGSGTARCPKGFDAAPNGVVAALLVGRSPRGEVGWSSTVTLLFVGLGSVTAGFPLFLLSEDRRSLNRRHVSDLAPSLCSAWSP